MPGALPIIGTLPARRGDKNWRISPWRGDERVLDAFDGLGVCLLSRAFALERVLIASDGPSAHLAGLSDAVDEYAHPADFDSTLKSSQLRGDERASAGSCARVSSVSDTVKLPLSESELT